MTRRRQIQPQALLELRDAAEWYEQQRDGLGGEFIEEFERTLDDALTRLATSEVVARTTRGADVRRFRLARFPRYAIYIVVVDVPVVVAFEHASRKPGYWRDRLK